MKEKLFLDIEQCIELQVHLVDMSDSEFAWDTTYDSEYHEDRYSYILLNTKENREKYNLIPTYTLQEILMKLPNKIGNYELVFNIRDGVIGYYYIAFTLWEECDNNYMIDSAYRLFLWAVQNGYCKDSIANPHDTFDKYP